MEVSDVRRRLRAAIDTARKSAQERRERSDRAARDYEQFLERAIPVFRTLASALIAEGYRFSVFTPAGAVRLALESSAEDYIELTLDQTMDPPAVLGRTSRGRGRRQLTSERPIQTHGSIADLTDDEVLGFLLEEIPPFVER
jgi:hypothetical protein